MKLKRYATEYSRVMERASCLPISGHGAFVRAGIYDAENANFNALSCLYAASDQGHELADFYLGLEYFIGRQTALWPTGWEKMKQAKEKGIPTAIRICAAVNFLHRSSGDKWYLYAVHNRRAAVEMA